MLDALALTPVEVGRSLMRYPGFAFAALLYAGLGPGGVTLGRAFAGSWPLLLLGLGSVLCGSLFAPVLNALVPRIPLWVQGVVLGGAGTAALLEGARLVTRMDEFRAAACWMFFPAAAGFMAARFAQALPDDTRPAASGKSFVLLLPAAVIGGLVAAALVLSKLTQWRIDR